MKFSKEEKEKRLTDWRQSGKSAWAYAKGNGINPQTFIKWTKPQTKKTTDFVEVPVHVIRPDENTNKILIEKGEMKIHVPLTVGQEDLRKIISALGTTV